MFKTLFAQIMVMVVLVGTGYAPATARNEVQGKVMARRAAFTSIVGQATSIAHSKGITGNVLVVITAESWDPVLKKHTISAEMK